MMIQSRGLIRLQGVCTEAGMYALRERRVHVTQEDFELAVAKVTRFIYLFICFTQAHRTIVWCNKMKKELEGHKL